jgi:hypothetical protein
LSIPLDQDLLRSCFLRGRSVGAFDEFAVLEPRAGADERDDDDVQPCWLKVVNSRQAKPVKRSVATQLVEIGRAAYTLGVSEDGTPFGLRPETPHVALPLRGGRTGLRAELAQRYFNEHMVAPTSHMTSVKRRRTALLPWH